MKNNNIKTVIDMLRSNDFYGGGDCVEIAKGKYQLTSSWNVLKTKVKRVIKSKK